MANAIETPSIEERPYFPIASISGETAYLTDGVRSGGNRPWRAALSAEYLNSRSSVLAMYREVYGFRQGRRAVVFPFSATTDRFGFKTRNRADTDPRLAVSRDYTPAQRRPCAPPCVSTAVRRLPRIPEAPRTGLTGGNPVPSQSI